MARILRDYPLVSLKPEELDGRIDFIRIFGRKSPVHIDIGSGRGTFLLNQGRLWPQLNFLGIEWASRYYRYAVDRIGRWGLKNVRVIRADAAAFLADYVPCDSVNCFHIYFPDPWPKKRHHRRRFFNPSNAAEILRCLVSGGLMKIATDHAEYFQSIQDILGSYGDSLEKVDFFPGADTQIGEWVGTNFERKYLREKREIYTIAVRKV